MFHHLEAHRCTFRLIVMGMVALLGVASLNLFLDTDVMGSFKNYVILDSNAKKAIDPFIDSTIHGDSSPKQPANMHNESTVDHDVDIGRDGNRLVFSARYGSHNTVNVMLELFTPEPKCGMKCIYRFYIDGPAHYSGYLTPSSQSGKAVLSAQVPVVLEGYYTAVVHLVSVGLDSVGPLHNTFPQHSFMQAWPYPLPTPAPTTPPPHAPGAAVARIRPPVPQHKIKFLGIMVSDPEVDLSVFFDVNIQEKMHQERKHQKECSFLSRDVDPPHEIFHVNHGPNYDAQTMMRGVQGGNDVAADGCRLVTSTVPQVFTAFKRNSKRKKLAIMMAGTSRVRYLSLDLWPMLEPFGWRYTHVDKEFGPKVPTGPMSGRLDFVHVQPDAAVRLAGEMKRVNVCRDPDTFHVIVISYAIWSAAAPGNRLMRMISPNALKSMMAVNLRKFIANIVRACPDRSQYRIVWLSNTAVHAIGNNRQPRLPLRNDPAEIVFNNSRTELSQSGPHMRLLRDLYRTTAKKVGDAYVPYHEVTLAARDEYEDHIHVYENHTSGIVGSKMIMTTMRQLFEDMKV